MSWDKPIRPVNWFTEEVRELSTKQIIRKSDPLILINMKRAEAEALFELGRIEEGDRAFEALIKEFPDSAWGYIGWGDMYGIFRPKDYVSFDHEKAERIYRLGLERVTEDRKIILDRLESLEEERKKRSV